jgi:hypothetical protein
MPRVTHSPRRSDPVATHGDTVRFSLANAILLGAGLAAVVGGFLLLANGSTAAAPLVLMLGFLVLIPWGIIK